MPYDFNDQLTASCVYSLRMTIFIGKNDIN